MAEYIRKENLYLPEAEKLPEPPSKEEETPRMLTIVGGREHRKKK